MKLVFTEQALRGLQECMDFFPPEVPASKVIEIRDRILAKTDILLDTPLVGQKELYLEHLELDHRRLVDGNYKIIYRICDNYIVVTDIFDTRQDPSKMKG